MSHLTLINNTEHDAQFTVWKGDQVIERLPGIRPNGQVSVPTTSVYTVRARAMIDGNTYTTAPQEVATGTRFLAQIKQSNSEDTYDFEMVQRAGTSADELQFEKTILGSVNFIISKDGKPLQTIAVSDTTNLVCMHIGDLFQVEAVIFGVTTRTVETTNSSAVIQAVQATSDLDAPYPTLRISEAS